MVVLLPDWDNSPLFYFYPACLKPRLGTVATKCHPFPGPTRDRPAFSGKDLGQLIAAAEFWAIAAFVTLLESNPFFLSSNSQTALCSVPLTPVARGFVFQQT